MTRLLQYGFLLMVSAFGIETPARDAKSPVAAQPATVVVRVVAERFRFSPDEIRIAEGQSVELHLESTDTDHGFHILGTGINRTIPKRGRGSIVVVFKPDGPGRYRFECSKVCGAGHDFMHGFVVVGAP